MDDSRSDGDGEKESLGETIIVCRRAPPALEPAEHDLDAVASFLSALVVFRRRLALLSGRDAVARPFAFQRILEPGGFMATISEQQVNLWQTAQQRAPTEALPCPAVAKKLMGRS